MRLALTRGAGRLSYIGDQETARARGSYCQGVFKTLLGIAAA